MLKHIGFNVLTLCAFALCAFSSSAYGQVTINLSGRIMWADSRWTDSTDTVHIHPVRRAPVEIRDARAGGSGELLSTVATDGQGRYAAVVSTGASNSRDIFIRVLCSFEGARVRPPRVTDTYFIRSNVIPNLESGSSQIINLTANNRNDNNTAFSVREAVVSISDYIQQRRGSLLPLIDVVYPTDEFTSLFDGSALHILLGDRWDWDVIMHEYGHYVSNQHRLDDSPGGRHSLGENLSERLGKDRGTRLAWGEGWPTFLAISAQRALNLSDASILNVGDTHYQDTDDATIDIDLEAESDQHAGEDNEVAVMRILYKLFNPVAGDDEVEVSDQDIWNSLAGARPVRFSAAWNALLTNKATKDHMLYGSILTGDFVAPAPIQPANDQPVGSSPLSFRWNPNGGGNNHRNDRFVVEFYDSAYNKLFTSPELSSNTYTPNQTDWDLIISTTRSPILWVVIGRNTKDPSTGRYMGKSMRLVRQN